MQSPISENFKCILVVSLHVLSLHYAARSEIDVIRKLLSLAVWLAKSSNESFVARYKWVCVENMNELQRIAACLHNDTEAEEISVQMSQELHVDRRIAETAANFEIPLVVISTTSPMLLAKIRVHSNLSASSYDRSHTLMFQVSDVLGAVSGSHFILEQISHLFVDF